MEEDLKPYRCVACGTAAAALTKSYGPTVLKLTTCESCGSAVDKYIEYDPVIVMIDLVLVTREALRHILHNTEFKTYWKLLLVLLILETYGVWCRRSIINLATESICRFVLVKNYDNSTVLNGATNEEFLQDGCLMWQQDVNIVEADPFISEKTFYITFISVFSGTIVFSMVIQAMSKLMKYFSIGSDVSYVSLLKAITIGNTANLLTLPLVIWGISDESTNHIHVLLLFAYTFLLFLNAIAVLQNFNVLTSTSVLMFAYLSKFTSVYICKYTIEKIVD